MVLPADYAERVYAGVLGKIIGVYLGRPFEGWTNAEIEERLGEITGYVDGPNPLVLTDDDISGTFTFLRALEDYGPDVTAAQIGQTWLNYVIEERTTAWWGGVGASAEHTAYLRLRDGCPRRTAARRRSTARCSPSRSARRSSSTAGRWPARAIPSARPTWPRRAAGVSHDGEAVHAAQVVAAMEAQAFVEQDVGRCSTPALPSSRATA